MKGTEMIGIATGRVATVRLGPNVDLVEALHAAAAQLGFARTLVSGGLGSLIDATIETLDGRRRHIQGPAIEILSLSGEISLEEDGVDPVGVSGIAGDTYGNVWAGKFVPGENPICVTIEVVLEEITVTRSVGCSILPAEEASKYYRCRTAFKYEY